jgi:hypothetical protein
MLLACLSGTVAVVSGGSWDMAFGNVKSPLASAHEFGLSAGISCGISSQSSIEFARECECGSGTEASGDMI